MKERLFALGVLVLAVVGFSVEALAAPGLIQPLATTSATTTQTCFVVNPALGNVIPLSQVSLSGAYVVFHIQLSNGTVIQFYYPVGRLTAAC